MDTNGKPQLCGQASKTTLSHVHPRSFPLHPFSKRIFFLWPNITNLQFYIEIRHIINLVIWTALSKVKHGIVTAVSLSLRVWIEDKVSWLPPCLWQIISLQLCVQYISGRLHFKPVGSKPWVEIWDEFIFFSRMGRASFSLGGSTDRRPDN